MYRFIDLFSGIGGIRLGLEKASKKLNFKTKCVFSSEIDPNCIETYVKNFGPTNFFGDITQLNNSSKIENKIPNFDILLAGFPCQPFSKAGLKKGFKDKRGKHFFIINKILNSKKPKAFLLENVQFLKNHNKGETLKRMLKLLRKNYFVPEPRVLNARDFGLPQNRERIFILGFLKSLDIKNFSFPKYSGKKKFVKDILDKEIDKSLIISDKLWKGHKKRKKANKIAGKGFGYHMVNKKSEYTRTLSARYYKDGSEILVETGINLNPRFLSINECKKLQGFPSSYKISNSKQKAYMQLGNSVPINIIDYLFREILKKIKSTNKSKIKNVA